MAACRCGVDITFKSLKEERDTELSNRAEKQKYFDFEAYERLAELGEENELKNHIC